MKAAMLRSPAVDAVRVAAIIYIVFRHTFVVPLEDQSILFSWTVPYFFFLTGWLWKPGARSLRGEMRRRWESLGVPYLSWFAIIWVVYAAVTTLSGELDVRVLLKTFAGSVHAFRPFTTFWFISALFFVALLYRLIERLSIRIQLPLAMSLLLLGSAAGPLLSKVPLSFGTAIVCVAFVIIARSLRELVPTAGRAAVIGAAGCIVLVVTASPWIDPIDVKYGSYGQPIISALASLGLCWSITILAAALFDSIPRLSAAVRGPATRLTSVATCVVLTHPFILFLIAAPAVGAGWWQFLAALILPWLGGLLLARTPLRSYLIGRVAPQKPE